MRAPMRAPMRSVIFTPPFVLHGINLLFVFHCCKMISITFQSSTATKIILIIGCRAGKGTALVPMSAT